MKDKKKFMQFMTGLGETFDKKITDTLKDIYWKALEPFDDEDCEVAFNQLILSCKFFPRPAEFMDILKGSDKDNALEAWGQVMDCLGVCNPDNPAKLDENIHQAVRAVDGWHSLAEQSYDDLKWTEKRFLEHYQVIEKRSNLEVLTPPKLKALKS